MSATVTIPHQQYMHPHAVGIVEGAAQTFAYGTDQNTGLVMYEFVMPSGDRYRQEYCGSYDPSIKFCLTNFFKGQWALLKSTTPRGDD